MKGEAVSWVQNNEISGTIFCLFIVDVEKVNASQTTERIRCDVQVEVYSK
jgi:hypothetical protein